MVKKVAHMGPSAFDKANSYVGHSTTTHTRRLTHHLSDISSIKQDMIKHNKDTEKFKYSDMRNIVINKTKIIYKNNNQNRLQILEAISIKNLKNHTINKKKAFNTGVIILNIFSNLLYHHCQLYITKKDIPKEYKNSPQQTIKHNLWGSSVKWSKVRWLWIGAFLPTLSKT